MAVMVVMLAMFVVLMIMAVVVSVAMTMVMMMIGMIVGRMTVRRMVVRFTRRVRVAITGIGATLRVERRFDLDQTCSEPLHHRFDHVVASDAQAASGDLRRQVTISEMPGDANQMLRIAAADFHQRLRRRNNFHQPAVFKHQCVATTQRHRIFEIQQELEPARPRHRHPPPVTIVKIEHDGVGRRLIPAMLAANLRGADHRSTTMGGVLIHEIALRQW
jgi:hypothetical protein